MIQGSDEWIKARLGKLGASRFADAIARTKGGWGASRANLRAQLIIERLTGIPAVTYTNAAMQWGTETEPQARAAYAFARDVTVEECGFIEHPTVQMSGASPDGLVEPDGLIEIKCPNSAAHIETLIGGTVDERYVFQMQWQMACTGRAWCDFVSFDPRLPPEMQLYIQRLHRDKDLINELEIEVRTFLGEVADTVDKLQRMYVRGETLKDQLVASLGAA